jgi:serine/threonine protein kinase
MDTAPGQARLWPEIDLSGEMLSGYALLKLLGSGGMGTVYEARGSDGVIVALKVLSPLLAAEPALRERFRREARALAAISHPGVVKMLGEGEENGFCWYAMERVTGTDLRERLKSGPLSTDEVRALGVVMFDALQVVHAAGFVHRDVKPSNILLAPEGPKLCDFGIARLEGSSTLTESAALLGSLRYMSPEQRWGKSDARSDLYALGVVLHEALALGVPGEKPLPPSTPASLTRLISKLTEQSPALRPQSAEAAKRMLIPVSKTPVLLAAAALVVVLAVSGSVLTRPGPQPVEVAIVDAGLAAEPMVVDAGPLIVAADPIDAGIAEPPDAGDVLANPTAKILRGLGTGLGSEGLGTIGTKAPPRGKPLSKKKLSRFEQPEPTESPKLSEVLGDTKTKISELNGTLEVSGTGAAFVEDGKTRLGDAPGTFSLAFGGHAIAIICKVGGTRQMRKVGLNSKKPTERISYECPSEK